ncbi:MAG: DUF6674 family protein [Oscillospiraceae bacterium]
MDYKLSEDENYHMLIDELDKRGLDKERNEVVGLVHYLESMEQQFTNVLDELQQVRCQLEKIQDKGIRKTVLKITDKAKEAVKKSLSKINTVKSNLFHFFKNVSKGIKNRSTQTLKKAVIGLRIPDVLSHLKVELNSLKNNLYRKADKIEIVKYELDSAKSHVKNAFRALFSKSYKADKKSDKGILSVIRKSLLKCGNIVSKMEGAAEIAMNKSSQFSKTEDKQSVKNELDTLKSKHKCTIEKPVPVKEQAR